MIILIHKDKIGYGVFPMQNILHVEFLLIKNAISRLDETSDVAQIYLRILHGIY